MLIKPNTSSYFTGSNVTTTHAYLYIGDGESGLGSTEGIVYQLNAQMPRGHEVVASQVSDTNLATIITNLSTILSGVSWPAGAAKHVILGPLSNEMRTGTDGWTSGVRLQTLITNIKSAVSGVTVWACTPINQVSSTVNSRQKDYTTYTKNSGNVESVGYKVIDLFDDVHFAGWSNYTPTLNTNVYQAGGQYLTAYGTRRMAEYIVDTINPPSEFHPALVHCGRFWRESIPSSAQYYIIDETSQHGKGPGLRSGASDGCPYWYADPNNIVAVTNSDPSRVAKYAGSFNDRDSGTTNTTFSPIRIPDSWRVPDVVPPNTPNEPGMIYNTTTGVKWSLNTLCRPETASNPSDQMWCYTNNIHAGAGINAPPIFEQDLNAGAINYATAINICGGYLYWNSALSRGWRWPATSQDSGGNASTYTGTDPMRQFGSRLAIPPGVTAASLGITSADGITIFNAAKRYGFIVSDTLALNFNWHTWSIGCEKSLETRLNNIHTEMEALGRALYRVEF